MYTEKGEGEMVRTSLDNQNLPLEMQLILSLMKNEKQLVLSLCSKVDWDQFLLAVKHHRIFPQIYHAINEQRVADKMPAYIFTKIKKDYEQNIYRMLHLTAEMHTLYLQFQQASLPLLFLKGPILAKELYGDLSLRTCADIDLLVPIERIEQAEQLMLLQGYEKDEYIESVMDDWKWRHHHFTYFHKQHRTKVEVHWRLHPAPSTEPHFTELWERRRESQWSSQISFPYLGEKDLFYFLSTHGARHGWSRLRWLFDIHQILLQGSFVNDKDWSHHLTQYQYDKIAGQALLLSVKLFNSNVKSTCMDKRASIKLARGASFYFHQLVSLHDHHVPKEIAHYHAQYLRSLFTLKQKFIHYLQWFYPLSEDYQAFPLPKKWFPLYYVIKPFLWLNRKRQILQNARKKTC